MWHPGPRWGLLSVLSKDQVKGGTVVGREFHNIQVRRGQRQTQSAKEPGPPVLYPMMVPLSSQSKQFP